MKVTRKIAFMFLAMSLCVINGAIAGDTLSMDGSISTKDRSETTPVDDAHMIILSNNTGTVSLADDSHPMHGATGGCSGTMLVATGKLSGGGYCTYKDLTGDSSIVVFTATAINEEGGTSGTWEMVGGTGKYSNATGGGSYSTTPNEDRTASINTISGEISL